MVGHRATLVARGELAEATHVGQEADQLEGLCRHGIGAGPQVGIVVEQMRQMVLQHAAAGAGGDDDIVVAAERIDDAACQVARGAAVAGVVGRLAAAGLCTRHLDLAAGFLQQTDSGETHGGAIQVNETGDEQRDAGLWVRHGGDLTSAAASRLLAPHVPRRPRPPMEVDCN